MHPSRQPVGIITLTLNPAIDETVFLDRLTPGAVNRASHHQRQAGGKGVNVSTMLADFGLPNTASGFLGRENTRIFEDHFRETGIRDAFMRIDGETRRGIKIVAQATRETTDINFPGARPTERDFDALVAMLGSIIRPGDWVVAAGSLPAGMHPQDFERLLRLIQSLGAHIAADTSGAALRVAIDCGVDMVKPNHHELAEILGHDLPDTPSRVAAAGSLQRRNIPHVVLSLGAEGALFATPEGVFLSEPPPVRVVSTVGAGDSLLAGYLAGCIKDMAAAERAKLATAFAWCALEDARRRLCPPKELDARMRRIRVQRADAR
jgi:1-phosphofructokinase